MIKDKICTNLLHNEETAGRKKKKPDKVNGCKEEKFSYISGSIQVTERKTKRALQWALNKLQ